MSNFNNFISRLENELPEMVRPKDLAKTGIFTPGQLSHIRQQKNTLPYMKAHGKVIYLKGDVLEWFRNMYKEGTGNGNGN